VFVCLFNSSSICPFHISKLTNVPITGSQLFYLLDILFGIMWVLSSFGASDHSVLYECCCPSLYLVLFPQHCSLIDSFCTLCCCDTCVWYNLTVCFSPLNSNIALFEPFFYAFILVQFFIKTKPSRSGLYSSEVWNIRCFFV
jgi:hypothetical protein